MKVAIDSGPLESGHKARGVGVYTREIIRALEHVTKGRKDIKVTPLDFSSQNSKFITQNVDLLHFTYFHPFIITLPSFVKAPEGKPSKIVVTIHDLIQLIYPKQYKPGFKGSLRFFLQKKRLKNTDAIIVPTETVKKDVVRFLGIPTENIKVIHEAPRSIFKPITNHQSLITARKKFNLPESFALYVGDINYNKNIPGLVEACEIANVYLVICGKHAQELGIMNNELRIKGPRDVLRKILGKPHPELEHLKNLDEMFGKNTKIIRLGFVSDNDLVAIYNLATVYVQPSFYEGFGLSVLEAMACGTPVIIGKTNSLVEIAGSTAQVADQKNPKDLSDKIKLLFNNASVRARLIREGEKRVKEFSWRRTAKETLNLYIKLSQAIGK